MVAVDPVCIRSPLTSSHIARLPGSSTSSRVTSQGPSGPNVSQPLPLSQVPARSTWYSRSETSLTTQYPATCESASSSAMYLPPRPVTTPSSTSQSVLTDPRRSSTSSSGPQMAEVHVPKTTGSGGT